MVKNNGITLITLVIMITVILILTSIFVATGLDALQESKNSEIENEIFQLKQAISDRYTSYVKNDRNIGLPGISAKNKWATADECVNAIISTIDFGDSTSEDKNLKIRKISNDISRDYDEFVKLITSGDAFTLKLENFSDDNTYVVDYYTGLVYGPIKD